MLKQRKESARKIHNRVRSCQGSGIVEGVVGLVIVMGGLILAILLMVNTGMAMYLKGKVAFLAQQTARHATGLQASQLQSESTAFAKELAARMGMDKDSTNIEVATCTVSGEEAIEVKISSSTGTFGGVDFLPKTVAMNDSAVAVIEDGGSGTYGYLAVPVTSGPGTNSADVYVPVVRPKLKSGMSTNAGGGVAMTSLAKPTNRLTITSLIGLDPYPWAKGPLTPFNPFPSQTQTPMGSGQWLNPGQNTLPTLR